MEKRTLGRTGLEVAVLGYGAMELRAGPPEGISDDESSQVLNGVLDGGINLVDTAPDYGLSEERIGKAIAHRRGEFYLATKCGCNIPRGDDPDRPGHLWTRAMLMHNIELSLRRLQTEYVDLWQMHNASPEQVQEEDLVRVMEDVKRQGKVRHVAISSTRPHITTYIQKDLFASYQIPYSAFQRAEEGSIRLAAEAGAGTLVRGGVAQGEPGEGRGSTDRWALWEQANLGELCQAGESRSAFLLRFTITHPHMHTTIVGTKSRAHLAENLQAAEAGPLAEEVYAEAKRRLEEAGEKPD